MTDETGDPTASIARATQRALVEIALRAYEEAGLSGLCADGRWEVAICAVRDYDVAKITSKQNRVDVP